ncbi:hypothetical protein HYC85_006242 [Camellia sinensis]|uniref:ER membrane protein complex subunit 6 n=1 Tax=Camellia sinensis TaxID=4442 RepID=A0A7J7HN49_CAMSI|nr:hypothetical protein HYC85_006242 [Camellia sinensis]
MFEQNGDDKSTFVVPLKMTPPTQASLLKMTPPTQAIEAMGGHDDSGLSEKKSIGVANDVPTFNAENMQNNMKAVYYSRTFMCIIGGVVAGILGFTGLTGFIFYFLVMAITSVGLVAKLIDILVIQINTLLLCQRSFDEMVKQSVFTNNNF